MLLCLDFTDCSQDDVPLLQRPTYLKFSKMLEVSIGTHKRRRTLIEEMPWPVSPQCPSCRSVPDEFVVLQHPAGLPVRLGQGFNDDGSESSSQSSITF